MSLKRQEKHLKQFEQKIATILGEMAKHIEAHKRAIDSLNQKMARQNIIDYLTRLLALLLFITVCLFVLADLLRGCHNSMQEHPQTQQKTAISNDVYKP